MSEKIANYKKMFLRFLIFLVIVIGIMCLSLTADNRGSSSVNDPNAKQAMEQKKVPIERQILNSATQGFQPSFEMKENVDFLLTPALLMQEAMSQNIVKTYPTE